MTKTDRAFINAYKSSVVENSIESRQEEPHASSEASDRSQPANQTSHQAHSQPTTVYRPARTRLHEGAVLPRPHFSLNATGSGEVPSAPQVTVSETVRTVRSLSSEEPVENRLKPAYSVESIPLPDIVGRLLAEHATAMDGLVDRMLSYASEGRGAIAMIAQEAGSGCSTAAICHAWRAAQLGAKVVLVDADFRSAGLTKLLKLHVASGLSDLLSGSAELADTLISQDRGGVTLLGQRSEVDQLQAARFAAHGHMFVPFGLLRDAFDLVLIDAGDLSQSPFRHTEALLDTWRLDGAVEVRLASSQRGEVIRSELQDSIITQGKLIGIVENAA